MVRAIWMRPSSRSGRFIRHLIVAGWLPPTWRKEPPDHLDVIDPLIVASAAHWRLSRMSVLDRMIMRLAVYEFLYASTPRPVVIDEALELAKTFSGEEAVGFVNGVLDAIRRRLDED